MTKKKALSEVKETKAEVENYPKNGSVVKQCSCKSEFQDTTYGIGKRLFNIKAGGIPRQCKCTVCGSSRNIKGK